MKLTINNDFRTFSKDETIELNFKNERNELTNNRFLFLIGNNGCGKSTLLKAIRNYKTEKQLSDRKEKNVNLGLEINKISKVISVEGLDEYEFIDAIDGELDNPNDWGNCGSASDYFENGGYKCQFLSNGTRCASTFHEWVDRIKDKIIPRKSLILIDEIERGWNIKWCANFIAILDKFFKGCDFVIVSHNPICILSDSFKPITYYDVESRSYVKSYQDYFHQKTDKYISLSVIDLLDYDMKIIKNLKEKLEKYEGGSSDSNDE